MGSQHEFERARAARVALVAGVCILALKTSAWVWTGSVAVLSDALESVINVAAAILLVAILRVAVRPADSKHPYGHGKIEYFAAGVEGALIAGAALLIVWETLRAWQRQEPLGHLDLGLALVLGATVINAGVGSYLLRTGRRLGSLAVEADGRHLLSDVVTSVGVLVGLAAVWWTGLPWIDSLVALCVAAHILWVGGRLLRRAAGALLDEADPHLLTQIVAGLETRRRPWWIDVHSLRASRAGLWLHADLHLVIPRFFDADRLHDVGDEIEAAVLASVDPDGEVIVHFDPCRPRNCAECSMIDCEVRSHPLAVSHPLALGRATRVGDDLELAE